MSGKQKLKPDQVAEALRATNGLVYLAAEKLGCVARTVYNYATRYKVVAEAIAHQKGKRLDTAEAKLWQAVLNGEAWAICFLLKCQGKDRGYIERAEYSSTVEVRQRVVEEVIDADGRDHGAAAPGTNGLSPRH